MKYLESTIEKPKGLPGFTLIRLEQTRQANLYAKHKNGIPVSFEVFKRKFQDTGVLKMADREIVLEAKELYPNNEDFGKSAWDIKDQGRAYEKFYELSSVENNTLPD